MFPEHNAEGLAQKKTAPLSERLLAGGNFSVAEMLTKTARGGEKWPVLILLFRVLRVYQC